MPAPGVPIFWPPSKRLRREESARIIAESDMPVDRYGKEDNVSLMQTGQLQEDVPPLVRQHKAGFFKDRHYLQRECPDLSTGPKVILEAGCGVGNTVYPLLAANPGAFVHACDFSPEAVRCLKEHRDFNAGRVNAFTCDIANEGLGQFVQPGSVDICTMVFVLSAISPADMHKVVANVKSVLRPGGQVFVRDYAAGDLAEGLLSESKTIKRIEDQFFVRGDGTCSYYFTEAKLMELFVSNGMMCRRMHVHEREVENHALDLRMARKWIQANFTSGTSNEEIGENEMPKALDAPSQVCEWDEGKNDRLNGDLGDLFEESDGQCEVEESFELVLLGTIKVRSITCEAKHTLTHTGLMLWDAGPVFANYLINASHLTSGKRVIELGCGSSPLCCLACLRHAATVVCTDGNPEALTNLAHNLALNSSKVIIERVRLRELPWGCADQIERLVRDFGAGFDIAIGSDVVYVEEFVPLLFKTAHTLLAGRPQAMLLLCHQTRRVSEDKINQHAIEAGFSTADVPFQEAGLQFPPAIRLLCFKLGNEKIETSLDSPGTTAHRVSCMQ